MLIPLLWVLFLMVCVLLMVIVLLQRGDPGGIGSAFGGGGGETAFGVKADATWKKATAFFAVAYFGLALILNLAMGRDETLADRPERPPAQPEAPADPGAGEPDEGS